MPGSGSAWSAPRRSSTSKKSCTPAGDCARSERQRRQILMDSVLALPPAAGITAAACTALGLSRATVPARPPDPAKPAPRPSPPRALTAEERQAVLDQLREPRFADLAPAEVYATLLDEGVYLCSIRTLYRILDDHDEVRERRDQLRHPVYTKPELLAEGPDQVWSWDITKLAGPAKWTYFYLYVILDIFSRRGVGWCVADADPVPGAVRRHPRKARRAARPADPPRRRPHEGHRPYAGRPRRHQVAQPAPHLQRQPVLGGSLQDPEIPAPVPQALRLRRGRQGLLSPLLRLVQSGPPSCRSRPDDARSGPLRPG